MDSRDWEFWEISRQVGRVGDLTYDMVTTAAFSEYLTQNMNGFCLKKTGCHSVLFRDVGRDDFSHVSHACSVTRLLTLMIITPLPT